MTFTEEKKISVIFFHQCTGFEYLPGSAQRYTKAHGRQQEREYTPLPYNSPTKPSTFLKPKITPSLT